jgi:NAD(P)-dependent dehydrogenase (short-subunit alcohol dehydrogenase family)
MKIERKESKIALVTGASSGIGEATAERLAMAGYKVYGTSRRAAQAAQRSFAMLPLDVTSDESAGAAVRELMRLEGRIDLLVNNAGFGVAPAGARPKLRYTAGELANRLRLLRRFAPAGLIDTGIRKDPRLEA